MAVELASTSLFSDPNLVAYYKLENVNDSKSSFHLTNYNTVTFTAGKFNNAANFGTANTNKRLDVASNLGITSGAMSISLWVKGLASIPSGTWEFLHHSANTAGAVTAVDNRIGYDYNAGNPRIDFNRYDTTPIHQYYTLNIGTTDYYNFIYSYNGSVIEGFVNGISIGSVAAPFTSANNNTGDKTEIANYGTSFNFASVMLDDIAIFSRGLTSTDAQIINGITLSEPNNNYAFFM